MQRFIKSAAKVSAVSIIACALTFIGATKANAQPKGMPEGYIGVTGGTAEDIGAFGGLSGRISFPKAKVSLRASLLGGTLDCIPDDCGVALFIPTVTYDIPVAKNTNVYVGAGYYSIGVDDAADSNGSGALLQVGAETGIGKKFVVYGDGNFTEDGSLFKAGIGYRL